MIRLPPRSVSTMPAKTKPKKRKYHSEGVVHTDVEAERSSHRSVGLIKLLAKIRLDMSCGFS